MLQAIDRLLLHLERELLVHVVRLAVVASLGPALTALRLVGPTLALGSNVIIRVQGKRLRLSDGRCTASHCSIVLLD